MTTTGNTKKRKKKIRERIMIAVSILLIIVSILGVIFVVIWNSKPFNKQKGEVYNFKDNSNYIDDVFVSNENQINFLIVGVDVSESLSDVILVASVDVKKKSIEVLQIPRDSYVAQTSTGKINSIYSFKGKDYKDLKPIERTKKIIYEQFQIPIDYYAVFTLDSFKKTVDAMGGIPISLPNSLDIENGTILPAGPQVLNGDKAEMFVRHRHSYLEADIGRVKAQRIFLAAAVEQMKKQGLAKITTNIIPQIAGSITSNMAVKDMANFAKLFASIDMANIRIHMIPGQATTINSQSVYAIHADETAKLLNEYFRPYSDDVGVEKLKINRVIHTGDWYENTDDTFNELIDGVKPGQKNVDSSSSATTTTKTSTKSVTTTKTTNKATTTTKK